MLGGVRRVHDVLAAPPICVSGQIVWVDRRAAGAGFGTNMLGRVQKQGEEM